MTVRVTIRKLHGSPHSATTITVDGVVVRSQLGPMSPEEIAAHVRDYLTPKPAARFTEFDPKAFRRHRREDNEE